MKKFFTMMAVAAMMFATACTGNTTATDENLGAAADSTEIVTDSVAVDSVAVDLVDTDATVEVEEEVAL